MKRRIVGMLYECTPHPTFDSHKFVYKAKFIGTEILRDSALQVCKTFKDKPFKDILVNLLSIINPLPVVPSITLNEDDENLIIE